MKLTPLKKNDTCVVEKIFDENDVIRVTETWHDKYDPDILLGTTISRTFNISKSTIKMW